MKSLFIAATGAQAQSKAIENIANNIANVNTTAFKKGFLTTTDLHYQTERRAGSAVDANSNVIVPTSIQFGSGTAVSAIVRDNKQGDAINTGNPLDIQISGNGYFALNMPDGSIAYTRDGSFQIDPETTQIVTALGYPVSPGITIPIDHQNIIVRSDGTILVQQPNNDTPQVQGQLDLAIFANPTGLELKGNNIVLQTDASGEAQIANPGQDNYGPVKSGWLEGSNVNPIIEMTDLVAAQRAYEMSVKAITTSFHTLEKIITI